MCSLQVPSSSLKKAILPIKYLFEVRGEVTRVAPPYSASISCMSHFVYAPAKYTGTALGETEDL